MKSLIAFIASTGVVAAQLADELGMMHVGAGEVKRQADYTSSQTYAEACLSMVGFFTSCTDHISDFTTLGSRGRASCYCCTSTRGALVWTDKIETYASSCATWAITGEPNTAYPLAKTMASYCDVFSDVCGGASATAPSRSTFTVIASVTTTSSSDSATGTAKPSGLGTGAVAGIAVGSAAVVLLIAVGAFIWWRKRKQAPVTQQPAPPPNGMPPNGMQPYEMPPNGAAPYGSPPQYQPQMVQHPEKYGMPTSPSPLGQVPPGQHQWVAPVSPPPAELGSTGNTAPNRAMELPA